MNNINDKFKEINLTPITKQIIANEELSLEDLEISEKLYRTFLLLHYYHPNQKLIPTNEVDVFWHNHILNSKKYFDDCNELFGTYLHHTPMQIENLTKTVKNDFDNTLKLMKGYFKSMYPNISLKKRKFAYSLCS